MALDPKKALLDIRKAKRATKLRVGDEEVVSNTLERIMQEAIALQESGSNTFSRSAIKEMKQIRKDLVAGQINAGAKQTAYIGKFSSIIDNIDNIDTDSRKSAKGADLGGGGLSSLKDSLPSIDTLTSAVMTANPILGYAGKMLRDITSSRKTQKRKFEEERKQRIQTLMKEEGLLEEQAENEALRSNILEKEKESLVRDSSDPYIPYLQRIESGIERFNEAFGVRKPEKSEEDEMLERIHDALEEQNQLQRENIQKQENQEMERKFESVGDGVPVGEDSSGSKKDLFGDDGTFDLFGGVTAGLTALMVPFMNLFGFLKEGGKMLMKFGKFTGILAAVMGIYDFIDGIFNAEEILGRGDLNIQERILVGISNVVSGLVSSLTGVVDWVAGLFGMEEIFGLKQEELTKRIFGWFGDIGKWFMEGLDFVKEMGEKGLSFVTDSIDTITNFFESISTWIEDKLNPIIEWISNKIDSVMNFGGNLVDGAKDKVSGAWNRVTGFFGGEEEEGSIPIQAEVGRTSNFSMDDRIQEARDRVEATRNRYNNQPINEVLTNSIERRNNELYETERTGGGGNAVIAPSSNQTNVNNNTFTGSKVSENNDPTHRRMNQLNGKFQFSY